jgi:hypothetical protein
MGVPSIDFFAHGQLRSIKSAIGESPPPTCDRRLRMLEVRTAQQLPENTDAERVILGGNLGGQACHGFVNVCAIALHRAQPEQENRNGNQEGRLRNQVRMREPCFFDLQFPGRQLGSALR